MTTYEPPRARFGPFPTPDRSEPRAPAPPEHDGPDQRHARRLSAAEAFRRARTALDTWTEGED